MQISIVLTMSLTSALLMCGALVLAAEDGTTQKVATASTQQTAGTVGGLAPALSDTQLQSAIKDRRYMIHQIKCTLGEGPCDSVGRKLKALAPLVMKNICFHCTPTEKRQIQIVASHIQRNFPAEWSKIVRQYGST